jgi:heme exporter protein D
VADAAGRHWLAMSLTLIALLALTVVLHLVRERL